MKCSNLIIIDNVDKAGPALKNSCPVCDYAILTSTDIESLRKFDCCWACAMRWAEGRKAVWTTGWRPSGEEFEEYLESRRLIPVPIPRF